MKPLQYVMAALILISGFLISDNTMRYQDEKDYTAIAHNLVAHHTYSFNGTTPTAMRPPGYVFFLAVFMFFGANVFFLKLLNFAALALSYLVINRILDKEVQFTGSAVRLIFIFCYPVLFYTAGTLYPQTLAGCLLVLILYRSYYVNSSARSESITGMLWAVLVLTVPTFAAVFVILHMYLYWRGKVTFFAIALHVLIIAVFITPWLVRNNAVFGSPRFSTNIGLNFIYGNSEFTAPNSGINVDIRKYQAPVKDKNEAEIDAHLFHEGLQHIRTNPGNSLTMYLAKTVNYFNYKNEMATIRESSALRDNVMLASYYLMLLILLVRILAFEQYKFLDLEKLLFLLYFSNAFISAVFFTRIRLRIPYDLLLIVLVVLYLERIVKSRIDAREKAERDDDLY